MLRIANPLTCVALAAMECEFQKGELDKKLQAETITPEEYRKTLAEYNLKYARLTDAYAVLRGAYPAQPLTI